MPKVKTVHVSIRLPKDLVRRMKQLAKRDGITLTDMIAPMLRATYSENYRDAPPVMDDLRKAAP